nr:MAG TPA: hypothetical protein [Crassvirales sp.]
MLLRRNIKTEILKKFNKLFILIIYESANS